MMDEVERAQRTWETRVKDANREWEKANEYGMQFAAAAQKGVLITNGGAVVAILGFSDQLDGNSLSELYAPVVWFISGMVAVVVSMTLGYVTQRFLSEELSTQIVSHYRELTDEERREISLYGRGRWIAMTFAILAGVGGLVCFAIGAILAASVFLS